MAGLAPIRREVIVAADPDLAFEVFTDDIGNWWPFGEHSVYGDGSTVAFRDGLLVESRPGAEDSIWATVTTWQPPHELALDWYPGRTAERPSHVRVRFSPAGPGRTLTCLEHSGWETLDDPAAARAEYELGWPPVLDRFEASVRIDHATWVALLHSPAIPGQNVLADSRFGRHVEFLGRMRESGWLVAAGPLGDEPGAGLTVLRLPGAARWEEAEGAAGQDGSVTGGLLTVRIRPWQVREPG
jgi:uncharacterized protein YndB with AHSA1/START domain/uncharacterized protein YciI